MPLQQDTPGGLPPDVSALIEEFPGLAPVARMLLESRNGEHTRSLQMLGRLRRLRPDRNARPTNPHRVVAFFDLDGTLLSGSIIQHLTQQAFDDGQGQLSHVLQFVSCYVLYKLNLIPRVTMYRWGYAPCVGQDMRTVQGFVDRCLEERIKPRVFKEGRAAVAAHRATGHSCVAITGAPDYAAAELCAALGLDDLLATRTPLTQDGRITDEIEEPVCYSDGKLDYLMAYAALHDVDLQKSFFYSDSASDIPVLKAVGKPRVINAQALLRPVAMLNGWPMARWNRLDDGGLPVAHTSRAVLSRPN